MIYLDNAATTPVDQDVLEEMLPYYNDKFYNPSSFYKSASSVRVKIEKARRTIAECMGASHRGIFFTSGGTESDNWAIRAAVEYKKDKGRHIISTPTEHPAVLNTLRYLESIGFQVTYLDVDGEGNILVDELEKAIRPDTVLISVMHANNEIGTLAPVEKIGQLAHRNDILFHTDAVQSFGKQRIDIDKCNIDLLSASSHKIYGPKGTGLLYINPLLPLGKLLFGGDQENGKRPGTENTAGIIGFSKAVENAFLNLEKNGEYIDSLSVLLREEIKNNIPGAVFLGNQDQRVPGIVSVLFPSLDSETILIRLDEAGIMASAGSACSAGAVEPSHVLTAVGLEAREAKRVIRFSLGKNNTKEEIMETARVLKDIFAG